MNEEEKFLKINKLATEIAKYVSDKEKNLSIIMLATLAVGTKIAADCKIKKSLFLKIAEDIFEQAKKFKGD